MVPRVESIGSIVENLYQAHGRAYTVTHDFPHCKIAAGRRSCALLHAGGLNNITDFGSNYEFVRHVLMMDSTFPGNHGLWRAIKSPTIHLAFYLGIIAWEIATGVLLWWGSIDLARAMRKNAVAFRSAKRIGVVGLTMSLLMWLMAFLAIGGEWFMMWQSHLWNGQEAAFRMFAVVGIVLLVVLQPDANAQP